MSLQAIVLGQPGRDNALWVRVDSGQQIHRVLFDCGDGCLASLGISEIMQTDELLFSHFHMDHVGGFDSFFRCNFNRSDPPVSVWGPPGTSEILHHRFRGFWWNLIEGSPGEWIVRDVSTESFQAARFLAGEAFAHRHEEETTCSAGRLVDNDSYSIECITLNHGGPTLGFILREKDRTNIDISKLEELGLKPGPWMKTLKSESERQEIEIDGNHYALRELREKLLIENRGESIAYLTDFLLDASTAERLQAWLSPCDTLVCEAQYCHDDLELAQRNHHTTVTQVADLAASSGVGKLVLFHLSDRYSTDQWKEMLRTARDRFENTSFPDHWEIQ